MNKLISSDLATVAAMVSALALAACGTEPSDDDHADPHGLELVIGGKVVASYDGDTQKWTGEMEVDVGEETPHITTRFVDDKGGAITPEDDWYLEVDVESESIAKFEQGKAGEFGGHLHGVSEGETDVTFKLMHGDVGKGHADFVTKPVHAHVHEHDE